MVHPDCTFDVLVDPVWACRHAIRVQRALQKGKPLAAMADTTSRMHNANYYAEPCHGPQGSAERRAWCDELRDIRAEAQETMVDLYRRHSLSQVDGVRRLRWPAGDIQNLTDRLMFMMSISDTNGEMLRCHVMHGLPSGSWCDGFSPSITWNDEPLRNAWGLCWTLSEPLLCGPTAPDLARSPGERSERRIMEMYDALLVSVVLIDTCHDRAALLFQEQVTQHLEPLTPSGAFDDYGMQDPCAAPCMIESMPISEQGGRERQLYLAVHTSHRCGLVTDDHGIAQWHCGTTDDSLPHDTVAVDRILFQALRVDVEDNTVVTDDGDYYYGLVDPGMLMVILNSPSHMIWLGLQS